MDMGAVMDWEEVLALVLNSLLKILGAIVIPYLVYVIRNKIQNETLANYIEDAIGILYAAVDCTNQTFVDELKKEGRFDKEAQIEAFNRSKELVMNLLSEAAKQAIIKSCGDLESWVRMQIESAVAEAK